MLAALLLSLDLSFVHPCTYVYNIDKPKQITTHRVHGEQYISLIITF